jgi:hypothetical protein
MQRILGVSERGSAVNTQLIREMKKASPTVGPMPCSMRLPVWSAPNPGCLFRRGNAASVAQEGATERGRYDGVKERGELAVTGKENLEKVATVPRCAGVISLAQNLLRLVGLGALADVTASRFLGEFSG